MANRRSPYRGARSYEEFRQRVVQRFTNFERDAANHIAGRNRAVAEVLAYLSMLRNTGRIAGDAVLEPQGARFQTIRGSRAQRTEAAHCLPCQIAIQGRNVPIETLLPNREARERLQALFGHVTDLPCCFNRADSAAERVPGGNLVQAFLGACEAVVRRPRDSEEPQRRVVRGVGLDYGMIQHRRLWPINREAVRQAYRMTWVPLAQQAYERARAAVAETGAFLHDADDPEEVLTALSYYLRHHGQEPSKLLDAQMNEMEQIFNSSDLAPDLGALR